MIFSWKDVGLWFRPAQITGCMAASFLIFLFGYKFGIIPLQEKYKRLSEKIVSIEGLIQAKKEKMKGKKQKASVSLEQNDRNLEVADILDFLADAASISKVKPLLFEPQPIKENDFYSIKIDIEGGYKNLLLFVNKILVCGQGKDCFPLSDDRGGSDGRRSNPGRFFYFPIIDSLVLEKKKKELKMELFLRFYASKYANKNLSSDIEHLSSDVLARDVFRRTNKKLGLHLWSSKELRFLGLVKQGEKFFGVLEDPMGYVYQVKVGDKVGLKQSEVIAIEVDRVMTVDSAENVYR